MDVRMLHFELYALQLQREVTVGGCKTSVWIKWQSVSQIVSGECAVALRRNCIDSSIFINSLPLENKINYYLHTNN